VLAHMLHRQTAPGRAQKFHEDASFKIALSSIASAKSFFSRVFSRSSPFNRRAWFTCIPAYSLRQR